VACAAILLTSGSALATVDMTTVPERAGKGAGQPSAHEVKPPCEHLPHQAHNGFSVRPAKRLKGPGCETQVPSVVGSAGSVDIVPQNL
jgi:hypothetical protein